MTIVHPLALGIIQPNDGRSRSAKTRFFRACGIGGAIAAVVFAWFLLEGRFDLFAHEQLANFYDVQARSLLHGHWDVPADSLSIERFNVGGRYYTYFGPWPAIMRMPVIAFTDELDGRLNRLSMFLAFTLILVLTARLAWQIRTILRGDGQPTKRTLLGAGAFVFVTGCGSTVLFLAGRALVYHEAILWGIAWSLGSYLYLVRYLLGGKPRDLWIAGATATLAILSRATVGGGPVLALAILLGARVAARIYDAWRRRHSAPKDESLSAAPFRFLGLDRARSAHGSPLPVLLAVTIPVALYAYVNSVKFGSLFGLPVAKQDLLFDNPIRRAAINANGGSLFGLKFAPTNLVQYFRPDGISFDRLFPWVNFSPPPRVFGNVSFADIEVSASISASSTLLFVLALVGIATVFWPTRSVDHPRRAAALLRIPVLAAAMAGAATLVFGYLANRYEGDFVPMLVIAGLAGLFFLPHLIESRGRVARRALVVVMVGLAAWSCYATAALTLLHQRAFGQVVAADTRARFLDFQLSVYDRIPGGAPSRVVRGDGLPPFPPPTAQSLFVVGDCAGLYWSDGRIWRTIEQTPATGKFPLRVRFGDVATGTRVPLLSATDNRGSSIVWARGVTQGRVRFEYEWTGTSDASILTSKSISVHPERSVQVTIRLDPVEGYVEVRLSDSRLLSSALSPIARSPAVVGSQDGGVGATRFGGTIRVLPNATPVCDRLLRLGQGGG